MTTALGALPARVFHAEGHSPLYRRLANRRKQDGPRPLDEVALDLILCANLGAAEADLRAVPDFLHELIDDLNPAAVRRTLDELDVEEQRLEARENELALLRRVAGDSPALLRAEATVNRAEARVQMERARLLEATARRGDLRGDGGGSGSGTQTPGRDAEALGRAISTRRGAVAAAVAPAHNITPPASAGEEEDRMPRRPKSAATHAELRRIQEAIDRVPRGPSPAPPPPPPDAAALRALPTVADVEAGALDATEVLEVDESGEPRGVPAPLAIPSADHPEGD